MNKENMTTGERRQITNGLDGFVHRFISTPSSKEKSSVTLLLLHGTGGNENDLIPLGRELAPNAAILSPRGKLIENGMPRFFRRFEGWSTAANVGGNDSCHGPRGFIQLSSLGACVRSKHDWKRRILSFRNSWCARFFHPRFSDCSGFFHYRFASCWTYWSSRGFTQGTSACWSRCYPSNFTVRFSISLVLGGKSCP